MKHMIQTIIGISGGSGSGKTAILQELRRNFDEKSLCILLQDDYYRPRNEQKLDARGVQNFDLPESIQRERMAEDVQKLIGGSHLTLTEYVFNNELQKPKIKTIHPAPVLIIEGLFIYHFKELRDLFDVKLFIHAKDDVKIIRRIKRDREERNYPLDDVLYRYQNHVTPTFEKFVLPYKNDCDIVINNNDSFEIGVEIVVAFIKKSLLTKNH